MRKASFIIATDFHLTGSNIELKWVVLKKLIEACKSNKVKTLLLGGDIFTSRSSQRLDVLIAWKDMVKELADSGINVISIGGNHDKTNLNDTISYLNLYEGEGFEVVKESGLYDIDGNTVALLPYFLEADGTYSKKLEKLTGKLKTSKNGKFTYLVTHVATDKAVTNGGKLIENEVKLSLFSKFDKVFVGHFHNKMKVGKNVYYIGSTDPSNFGEDNEKGFTVVYDDGSHELVNSEVIEYHKKDIDVDKVQPKDVIKLAEKMNPNKYKRVRFVLQGESANINKIDVMALKRLGVDVKKKDTRIVVKDHEEVKIGTTKYSKALLSKEFVQFCKHNDKNANIMKKGLKKITENVDA